MSSTSDPTVGIWDFFDFLEQAVPYPGLTTIESGGRYGYLNGTSMASPHAAGVAALIVEQHPNWNQGAVKAALLRTAVHEQCPDDWEPLGPDDERLRCFGGNGHTSFFGHGVVSAANAVD
jgi:subtilisin family serine protease